MKNGILLAALFCLFAGPILAQPSQPNIIWDPSPNYSSGRTTTIDTIVIHTTEGSYGGAVSWLKNPASGASTHYIIKEDGSEIKQLVSNSDRAWHATYYNNRSIGIECAGFAGQASTWTQGILPALYDLVAWLCYTYNVQAVQPAGQAASQSSPYTGTGLVGHYQIQPWNRTDPGAYFDWNTFVSEVQNRLSPSNPNDRVIDNVDPGFSVLSGSWSTGSSAAGKYGADYRFAGTGASVTAACEWRPNLPVAGDYEVEVYYPEGANRADDAPFTVHHANGTQTVSINQQINGGGWVSLGTYPFFSGTSRYVKLENNANPSVVIGDAVRFKFDSAAPAAPAPTGLVATPLNSTDVQFDWNWSAYADGYWVDIAESASDLSGTTGTFQNVNVGRTNTHTWTGLTPGQTYYWRVYAYNTQGGNHGMPTPASFTLSAGTPPSAATGLVATVLSDTEINFTWNVVAGTDGYWLDIAESPADLLTGVGAPSFQNVNLGPTTTTYNWTGLVPGTTYYWRVFTYNSAGGVHAYPTPTGVTTTGGGHNHGPGGHGSGNSGSNGNCSTGAGENWLLVGLLSSLIAVVILRRRTA